MIWRRRPGIRCDAIRLRVRVSNVDASEGIQILVNDVPVPQTNVQRVTPDSFEASGRGSALAPRRQQIVVLPGPGIVARIQNREGTAPLPATIDGVELAVHYRQR